MTDLSTPRPGLPRLIPTLGLFSAIMLVAGGVIGSGEPTCAAITPALRKIPEPITPPATSMTALKMPKVGISLGGRGVGESVMRALPRTLPSARKEETKKIFNQETPSID